MARDSAEPVWPRMIRACLAPGCKYVESASGLGAPAYCPAHHVVLSPVSVIPAPTGRF